MIQQKLQLKMKFVFGDNMKIVKIVNVGETNLW